MTSTKTTRPYSMSTPSHEQAEDLAVLLAEAGIPCRAIHGSVDTDANVNEETRPSKRSWVEIPDCDGERGLKLWVAVLAGRERENDVRVGMADIAPDDGHNFFGPKSTIGRAEAKAWQLACLRDAFTEDVRSVDYFRRWCAANGVPVCEPIAPRGRS